MDIVSQFFITFYFNEIENYMRPTTQVSAYRCLRLYAWVSPAFSQRPSNWTRRVFDWQVRLVPVFCWNVYSVLGLVSRVSYYWCNKTIWKTKNSCTFTQISLIIWKWTQYDLASFSKTVCPVTSTNKHHKDIFIFIASWRPLSKF